MSKKYFRHVQFGHVVELTGVGRAADVFRGVVVEQGGGVHGAAVGTYSDMWSRDSFAPCDWYDVVAAPIPVDTVESMRDELEYLRLALAVDIEPLDTLPERMLHAATVYRKLFVKVKAAVDESR